MYFWQLCQAQWKQNCIGSGTCVRYACKGIICVTVSYLLPVSLLGAAFVHTKFISCFWLCTCQFYLSYLTYVIRCNQYSACNHSVYTTCTHYLHHPSLYILAPWIHKCLHFVVLSPDFTLHDAFCCLYTIFFQKKAWWPGHF